MPERQKRVALVNDITGFGRCSITVELPIISALKIQACPLPTAILSVHTGFASHVMDDYTEKMRAYMNNWRDNKLSFDGICTGFLGSKEQIDIVIDFINMFRREGTKVMVDPVMGDGGRLYASYTKEICQEMRKLLAYADLVTPNLTEACELLDISYPRDENIADSMVMDMAKELSEKGPRQVVITGLESGGMIKNFVYERGGEKNIIAAKKIGDDRSGTGDVFAAVLAGSLLNGATLCTGVKKATDFISRVLAHTLALGLPWNYGLAFEEYLTEL